LNHFQAEVEVVEFYEHCSLVCLDQGICKPDLSHTNHKFFKRKCITNPTAYKFNQANDVSPTFNTLEILGLLNAWILILSSLIPTHPYSDIWLRVCNKTHTHTHTHTRGGL